MLIENCCSFYVFYRIQYGFGQFSLGDNQAYFLSYEPNNFCLKIIVSQFKKISQTEKQLEAFKLFVSLMIYIERSLLSVMGSYLPSAKPPVLHVCCPLCDNPNPHVIIELDEVCSLSIPTLVCAQKGLQKVLPPSSYLPFGDALLECQETGMHTYKMCYIASNLCKNS